MNLGQFQETFVRCMLEPEPTRVTHSGLDGIASLSVRSHAELLSLDAERLALYKELVTGTLGYSMAGIFPRLKRTMGQSWYPCLAHYFAAYPPVGWDSDEVGSGFPTYLDEDWLLRNHDAPEWWSELARYELAETEAYQAPNGFSCLVPNATDIQTNKKGTSGANPSEASEEYNAIDSLTGQTRVEVTNSLQLVAFQWDIPAWCQKESEEEEFQDGPEVRQVLLAIFRDADTDECRFLSLSPVAIAAIEAWQSGHSIITVAELLASSVGMSVEQCQEQLVALATSLAAHKLVRV